MSIQDPKTKAGQQQQQSSGQPKNADYDKGRQQPKVTNQEQEITNADRQKQVAEEPVEERSAGKTGTTRDQAKEDRGSNDPEIDMPIPDPEKTEKKIPTMKGDADTE